ncbi:MAG: hypothetical protein H0U86_02415 [Chloroflexi bacterium]|nr:hypothetical protein [Chloroflexota bacterium]
MTIIAALALMLAAIAPVLAAPTGVSGSRTTLADHVTDCNVTFDAGGNLLLDGSALTVAEAALLDALLLADAELAAALLLAADADADACVNLSIDLPSTITLNADILVCGDVVIEGAVYSVGGAVIGADLLTAELENLLDAAAAAGVEACVGVTVTDNAVTVDVLAQLCVTATLLDTGVVSVDIGGTEFFFDGLLVDVGGLLEVGVSVEVSLAIVATLDVAAGTVELTLIVSECAAAPTPSPTATTSPTGTVAPTTTGTAAPAASLLPNTTLGDGSGDSGPLVPGLALVAVASLGAIGYRALAARRAR